MQVEPLTLKVLKRGWLLGSLHQGNFLTWPESA